jgi:hypothetical protein
MTRSRHDANAHTGGVNAGKREHRVTRRNLLAASLGWMGASVFLGSQIRAASARTNAAASLRRNFDHQLAALGKKTKLLEAARSLREAQSFSSPGAKPAPTRPLPSQTPISDRARELIIVCEVTSADAYDRLYQHPTWPKGSSGVTIGVGYDVGYAIPAWLQDDWREYISSNSIETLITVCGVTGERANRQIASLKDVMIGWAAAKSQFLQVVLPRTVGETEAALPNTDLLPPDALGALVSLDYNRGPSFGAAHNSDRYREMRAIKAHMSTKEFGKIPSDIRSMKRLWKGDRDMAGLIERRELEALLFELGLDVMRGSQIGVD